MIWVGPKCNHACPCKRRPAYRKGQMTASAETLESAELLALQMEEGQGAGGKGGSF